MQEDKNTVRSVREENPVLNHAAQRDDYECLKIELNNLIWKYSPGEISLEIADMIAQDCLLMIIEGRTAEKLFETRKGCQR